MITLEDRIESAKAFIKCGLSEYDRQKTNSAFIFDEDLVPHIIKFFEGRLIKITHPENGRTTIKVFYDNNAEIS